MGPRTTGEIYALLLKDCAYSYVWIEVCSAADIEITADVLPRWIACFGVPPNWVSDHGTHLQNQDVDAVNLSSLSDHDFVTPDCPHPHGSRTIETVCEEVLVACWALLYKFCMMEKSWPGICRPIQSIFNHTKRPSFGNIAPITTFTGTPPDRPLLSILPPREA